MTMETRCSKVIFPNYSKKKPAEDTLVPPLWETREKNVCFLGLFVHAAVRGGTCAFSLKIVWYVWHIQNQSTTAVDDCYSSPHLANSRRRKVRRTHMMSTRGHRQLSFSVFPSTLFVSGERGHFR